MCSPALTLAGMAHSRRRSEPSGFLSGLGRCRWNRRPLRRPRDSLSVRHLEQRAAGSSWPAARPTKATATDNPIGVNVQTEDFDIGRLANEVTFDDNGIDLDTNILPVPEMTPPL